MKIAYIYTSFTLAGGADRVVIDKANYFAEHGYDITIVTDSQQHEPTFFPLSPQVKHLDLSINFDQEYKYNPIIRIFIYFRLMKKYKNALYNFLQLEKPDIVITTFGRSMDFLVNIKDGSAKICESHIAKPYIRNLHSLGNKGPLYWLIAKMWMHKITKNCKKLNKLVLLTEDDAKNWEGFANTCVIPNPIPFNSGKRSSCKNKSAIFVARMCEQKGYDYLLQAWEIVNAKHPDWILNIYGDGEEKENIIKQLQRINNNGSIIINNPTREIEDKYVESSICILSSRFEGFGMVLLEAMACGVPCVAFDCPYGPSQIIRDGEDGLLVEYLSTKALADSICKLIENESLRIHMGNNAQKNIQRFNKDVIMRKWCDLFDQII